MGSNPVRARNFFYKKGIVELVNTSVLETEDCEFDSHYPENTMLFMYFIALNIILIIFLKIYSYKKTSYLLLHILYYKLVTINIYT
jgi:hypothetical protein